MRLQSVNPCRWLAAAFIVGALLLVGARANAGGDDRSTQPVGVRAAAPSLQGRTIRVGLPAPIGARGMLRGTREDPQGYLKVLFEQIAAAEGLKVEFVALDKVDGTIHTDELEQGRIDVIAGMTVGETNLRKFRLSAPVVVTPGVAVTRAETSPPRTVEDLRPLKVAVPAGGAGRTFAAEQNLTVVPHPVFRGGFDAVVSGEADVVLTTMLAAKYQIEKEGAAYSGLRVTELEPVGFRRAYAYAVRAEDGDLMLAIESGLLALHQNGRLKEIYEQEVSRYQPLTGPRSVELSSVIHVAAIGGGCLLLLAVVWQWTVRRRLVSLTRVLTESEQRYRGIFDNSQDSILVVDPKTQTVMEANAAAERIYGYDAGQMVGLHVQKFVATPELVPDRMKVVLDGKSLNVSRSRHRRRDGRPLVMDVHASMGTIGGRSMILAISRDVTAAFSYQELVRSVIESSPHVAIQGFDRNGLVHFWNEASTRLYGWTSEEAVGRRIADLIGVPESHDEQIQLLAKLEAENRSSGLMEFQVRSKSGDPRWVVSEIVPAPNLQGELQFVCVDIDITAMKLAERRLQDAQARLAAALDAAGMGTWSIDVVNDLIVLDQSMVKLLGLPIPAGVPVPTGDAGVNVDPEDRAALSTAYLAAVESGQEFKAEYRSVQADGSRRWIAARGKLIRDDTGSVVRIGGASVDITDAKQAAADGERLRDELERARRLEGLGLLAGGLAHDFNNLLVGIRGNTELALDKLDPSNPARRALELVVQATDRTADLTSQLLAAAGRSRLAPEHVDLNSIAIESVALLRPRLGRGVSIEFDLTRPAVRTRADGAQTRQALSNLLTNAADALGAADGRIIVRTGTQTLTSDDFESGGFKVRSSPGEYAFIEVTDNGCGMDERVLSKVFDPFYTTKSTGRGLGLSLVLMTVTRHEGAIWIRSGPDKGTSCRLLLPLVAAPMDAPKPQKIGAPQRVGHALVIDDEAMVRQVIAGMLKQNGWTTAEVVSGEAGVRRAAEERFDIVFLDLTMPGLSGVETAAALRASMPDLPIVFVSGYSRDMAESNGSGGALANEVFVQKPFDAATLHAAAADAMLRGSVIGQQAPTPQAETQQPQA